MYSSVVYTENYLTLVFILWYVSGFRFKVALTNPTNRGDIFGAKFVVKYWDVKNENRKCCPQHGALNAFSTDLAFSAVTIAVSEHFLLPAAENWCPVAR